ncbi:hypothetical protein B0T26DRAFT_743350 [Lasiosphaeria miniovina]|uniref:Cerato-platanin n=1 Tax=Lasiosphaeria miniovina TaxID=1954250 RepID=A0AA40A6L6_9PEZI|nr:uncharacterized protein B0T26DRAFT_743350 [Lasiosphaeria miniovina]KAK0710234.1 hypothetical protein B0T26DRAFT_743350 [Lasiosphaeria miniovina]
MLAKLSALLAAAAGSASAIGISIDTNRVAYWPMAVDCNNICVRVSYSGRSLNLLRVDQSGGAYDISYDAWNTLVSGQPATVHPVTGGSVAMDYDTVPADQCASLLHTGALPLSAANSMNFLFGCLARPSSWVANHYQLYNIANADCTFGHDEQCTLPSGQNQATCPHQLGATSPLVGDTVYNVQYGTGALIPAP